MIGKALSSSNRPLSSSNRPLSSSNRPPSSSNRPLSSSNRPSPLLTANSPLLTAHLLHSAQAVQAGQDPTTLDGNRSPDGVPNSPDASGDAAAGQRESDPLQTISEQPDPAASPGPTGAGQLGELAELEA